MRQTMLGVVTTMVLVSILTTTCGLGQNNVLRWSTFDMGFGLPSASTSGVKSAVGQPFVGLMRIGNNMIESGFLVDSLFRSPLTAVGEDERLSIPTSYDLLQNYPNPFNPSTTIRYALPKASRVSLTVHNSIGQRVAIVVNEQQEAGYHDVVFAGSNVASGVYFYRLQAGDYMATKKLLVLK